MELAAWKARYQRLLQMGPAELRERTRQQLTAHSDLLRYRLGWRFIPKKRSRVASEAPRFFFSAENVPALCALLRRRLPTQGEEILRRAERICQHRFDLLGYEGLNYGAEIDWHWDRVHNKRAARKPGFKVRYLDFAEVGDSKVTWELNRHQHLVTLAKAHCLSGEEKFAVELFRQWEHWHRENPYPMGVNWASSLEVAFRSLSWLWVYFLLSGSPAMSGQFRSQWLQALGASARHLENHLSTYFSPNTHLLGEGVALFFIGTLCPELESAPRWQRRGWEIVLQEAKRQVRMDGFHFEQSTYYHVYALDFFLHSAVLASLNQISLPDEFERTVIKMLEVLCLLSRSGPVPQLGDDDGGRLFDPRRNRAEHILDPLATGAVLFGRGDFKSASGGLREETMWLLGEQGVDEFDRLREVRPAHESVALQASGLYLMTNAGGDRQLVIDAGPQGVQTAGHGHADAFSVAANYCGRPLLIDSGTFEYMGKNSVERDRFRGTPAHNTLVVDGLSQAEPKGPFAWTRLPRVTAECWINGKCFDLFAGSHDGYARLSPPVMHRRWVFSRKSRFWLVRDLALGSGKHQLDLYWHLPSTFSAHASLGDALVDREREAGLHIIPADEQGWSREIVQGQCSPVYGCVDRCTVVRFRKSATLPVEFVTVLVPVANTSSDAGKVVRLSDSSEKSVSVFRYFTKGEEHSFFWGEEKIWKFGDWHSDARFLYWQASLDGSGYTLVCCQFTFLQTRGQNVVSCRSPVLRCEITSDKGQAEVVCPGQEVVVDGRALEAMVAAPAHTRGGNLFGQGAKS
jgi:heparinase II/III-like protein